MAIFYLEDSSINDYLNETTREMKEFKKKYGSQKGSRASDMYSPEKKKEINKNNLYYSSNNVIRGKIGLNKDRFNTNLNRLRANVQYKDALKNGASKEELNKQIEDARNDAIVEKKERDNLRAARKKNN